VIGTAYRRTGIHRPLVAYTADGTRTETTYKDLNERANRFANAYLSRGLGRGGRIASMARNSPDVVAAYYGALKVGAPFTGVNPLYREAKIAHQLTHYAATLVLADPEFRELVGAALPAGADLVGYGDQLDALLVGQTADEPDVELDQNDIALIVYTSGTEATPKGVMIPRRNYLASTTTPAWAWGVETRPRPSTSRCRASPRSDRSTSARSGAA
jgi:acyl-CoA synthetase (AMP-forming)/AMP-acid ligase II